MRLYCGREDNGFQRLRSREGKLGSGMGPCPEQGSPPAREPCCLAWSPNGRLLATGSFDTTLLVWDVTGTALCSGRPTELTRGELALLWEDLASEDAAAAYRGMKKLAASPRQSLAFLAERL